MKYVKVGCLTMLGLFVLLAIIGSFIPEDPAAEQARATASAEREAKRLAEVKAKEEKAAAAKEEVNRINAYIMSQEFVKRKLKAPATAKFPRYSNEEVRMLKDEEGVYVVSAYVDSQNSFGALIRTGYICLLKPVEDDKWQLVSLDLFDR